MARLANVTCNKETREILKGLAKWEVYDYQAYNDILPSWVHDCLSGATAQYTTGTRPLSSYKVFSMLCSLQEVSTVTVGVYLNRKHEVIHGKPMSKSMVGYWTTVLHCASKAIKHHYTRYKAEDELLESETQTSVEYVAFTKEQKEKLRELALAGNKDIEFTLYLKEITVEVDSKNKVK